MILEKFNLEKGKIYSIVGISKNSGKTTTLNQILKEAYNNNLICGITTTGIDGEKKDSVFKHPKPEIITYPGFYIATSQLSFLQNPGIYEIIENTGINNIYGNIYIAKSLKKSKIELINSTNLSNMLKILKRLRMVSDIVLVDGAFDRVTSASPFICDGFIYAISISQYKSLAQFEKSINDLHIKLSINNTWLLKKKKGKDYKDINISKNHYNYSENIATTFQNIIKNISLKESETLSKVFFIFSFSTNIADFNNSKKYNEKNFNNTKTSIMKSIKSIMDKFLNNKEIKFKFYNNLNFFIVILNTDSLITISKKLTFILQYFFKYNLIGLYTPGALTDSIAEILFNANFKKNNFNIIIKDFTKYFLTNIYYKKLLNRNIAILPLFYSELKGITISSFSNLSKSLNLKNPKIIKALIKKYFDNFPVIDLFTD